MGVNHFCDICKKLKDKKVLGRKRLVPVTVEKHEVEDNKMTGIYTPKDFEVCVNCLTSYTISDIYALLVEVESYPMRKNLIRLRFEVI